MKTDRESICQSNIFALSEAEYGDEYKEHFLQIYQQFVESINYTSELKLKVNTYFLTINTALITAAGFALSRGDIFDTSLWKYIVPLGGLLISLIWWAVTYMYKQRNIIKLLMIHCLEKRLPLSLYKTEWELMQANHHSVRKHFFQIDLFVPWVFVLIYILLFLFA